MSRCELPSTIPEHDPSGLWAVQQQLITLAEQVLGQRDRTQTLYQPVFRDDGPRLVVPSGGAYIALGEASKASWPMVIFEMSHETIHLLNPTVGYTNWLEEGIAVAFSIRAQGFYEMPRTFPNLANYLEALELVGALPGDAFFAARRAREVAGALNAVTYEQLCALFPMCDESCLRKLAGQCVAR